MQRTVTLFSALALCCIANGTATASVLHSPLLAELLKAQHEFDLAEFRAVQQRIIRQADSQPRSFEDQFAAAESYRLRASWDRTSVDIGQLKGAAKDAGKEVEVAAGTLGIDYALRALNLGKTNVQKAQANRVVGELYSFMISNSMTMMHYGPKGLRYITRGGKLAPNEPECKRAYALFFLAAPRIAGGDKARGLEMLQALVEQVPESDTFRVLLSIAYRDGKKSDVEAALHEARKAAELNPSNTHARFLLKQLSTAKR